MNTKHQVLENKGKSDPMIIKKPPLDWRFRVVTLLAEDFTSPWTGILHKQGAPISIRTLVRHNEHTIEFGDPSASALFLSQSYKAFEQSQKNYLFLLENSIEQNHDSSAYVFDYLEQLMVSIIFAITAIEAFANEEIQMKSANEVLNQSPNLPGANKKDSIERRESLDRKLELILPELKGLPSPKDSEIWKDYKKMKCLRDRIIHLKSRDRAHSKADDPFPNSIWSQLLHPNQLQHPLVAKRMMFYFVDKENFHWLKNCPF